MADVLIDLEAHGIEEASWELSELGRRALNVKPAWDAFARFLMKQEVVRFQRQAWAPLDEDTIRQKGNARILHLTGTLERALTVWKAPGQKLSLGRQSMTFGLQPNGVAYYGAFHQDGQSVPVRRPLDLPWNAERKASDLLLDHIMGRL